MKTKATVVIAIIFITTSFVCANLIDLTPGGFDLTQPFPTAVANFFARYVPGGMENIAGANIVNGQPVWSPFTPFGSDHFGLMLNVNGTGAKADWNLFGTGFHSMFVFVESSALMANLYRVPCADQFAGDGFVEIDDTIPLLAVTFTGADSVPDTGSTLTLLGIGVLGLCSLYKLHEQVFNQSSRRSH
jgi:hypothetical protein